MIDDRLEELFVFGGIGATQPAAEDRGGLTSSFEHRAMAHAVDAPSAPGDDVEPQFAELSGEPGGQSATLFGRSAGTDDGQGGLHAIFDGAGQSPANPQEQRRIGNHLEQSRKSRVPGSDQRAAHAPVGEAFGLHARRGFLEHASKGGCLRGRAAGPFPETPGIGGEERLGRAEGLKQPPGASAPQSAGEIECQERVTHHGSRWCLRGLIRGVS